MPTSKLYPSPPLEPVKTIEQRLEWKVNDENSFHISANDNTERITYFKDENQNEWRNIKNKIC